MDSRWDWQGFGSVPFGQNAAPIDDKWDCRPRWTILTDKEMQMESFKETSKAMLNLHERVRQWLGQQDDLSGDERERLRSVFFDWISLLPTYEAGKGADYSRVTAQQLAKCAHSIFEQAGFTGGNRAELEYQFKRRFGT
jgi:hypothetical protein